jgi:hypothetical protein
MIIHSMLPQSRPGTVLHFGSTNPNKETTMEKFDYKVLWNKRHGLREDWFDGDANIGHEITTELLSGYGEAGWELVATMQMVYGATHKIILKRRRTPDQGIAPVPEQGVLAQWPT